MSRGHAVRALIITVAGLILFSSCSKELLVNTNVSNAENDCSYENEIDPMFDNPYIIIERDNYPYRYAKTTTLAIIEVTKDIGEGSGMLSAVSKSYKWIICDYLYIYNRGRLEKMAEKDGVELVLTQGRESLKQYPYYYSFCLLDERCVGSISKGDILLVELTGVCDGGHEAAEIKSVWEYKNGYGAAFAAKYVDGKLALAELDQSGQSLDYEIKSLLSTAHRLYLDEPHEPGSTYECIHDGMTVEETIAFFGHLEEDIKRFEEEYPDMIYNEVVVY